MTFFFRLPITTGFQSQMRISISVERRLLKQFALRHYSTTVFRFEEFGRASLRFPRSSGGLDTALDFRRAGMSRFIAKLKRDLMRDFDQLEVLITESALRVH